MSGQYIIMFADVAGSTQMYDKLGNEEAEKQISWCVQTMTSISNKFNGRLIKTIGDEAMVCFNLADEAVQAAIEMQTTISGDETNSLSIRIGMQFGEAIERDGDLFGDAVNVAARMAGVAKSKQIITTEGLVSELSAPLFSKTRLYDSTTVKGKMAQLNIYQVNWEAESNVTQFAVPVENKHVTKPKNQLLSLNFEGKQLQYSSDNFNGAISIGRDDSCTIALDATFASRSHVNIECRRGKFILADHSTNGTYVEFNGQGEIFIRREELTLMGTGIICLGESVANNSPSSIHFTIG